MEKYKNLKFLVMAIALVIVAGCEKEDNNKIADWGLELDRHLLALVVPNQTSLTATVKDVTWSSSDNAVASVDNTGKVTAVAEGTANITATTKEGKTATCTVIVSSTLVPVTGVTLSPTTLELKVAEKRTLQPVVSPDNATFKVLTWYSSNNAVASVAQTGEITAVATGTATITGTTIDGSNKTVTCTVNVTPTLVTGVTLDKTKLELMLTEKANLNATVSPSDANVKDITWSSSDETVASVTQTGEVAAVSAGTATITVTTVDGARTATCEVTVKPTVLVTNGDLEGDDLTTSFQFTDNALWAFTAAGEGFGGIGRALKITNEAVRENDWNCQFWVKFSPTMKLGEVYEFAMDVKSDVACSYSTQSHRVPTDYLYWACVGTISSTPEWKTYTYKATVDANMVGTGAIAFNLGLTATTYYIDNVSFNRIK